MLTIDDVRKFLNDSPESNRLLKRFEFSADRITAAIKHCINDWNETPPIVNNYSAETFPYTTTLLYGVVAYLLSSEAISSERNHLTYQSGGLTVDDSNHSNAYLQLSNQFLQKYKDLMERQKKVENWNGAWSYIRSPMYGQ